MQIKQTVTVLSTSLREILSNIIGFVNDVYITDPRSDYRADEMVDHIAYLRTPTALKKALREDKVCCAIYFDMAVIERLTEQKMPFEIEVLDDDGNLWTKLSEDELGEW